MEVKTDEINHSHHRGITSHKHQERDLNNIFVRNMSRAELDESIE